MHMWKYLQMEKYCMFDYADRKDPLTNNAHVDRCDRTDQVRVVEIR